MDMVRVYALLRDACRVLDDAEEHAIAAYVGLAMALVEEKYGVGRHHPELAHPD